LRNLGSTEIDRHHFVARMNGFGILKLRLANVISGVAGLCCIVLAQGLAYASPPPEGTPLLNGINLHGAQPVIGVVAAKTGDKALSNGVNSSVEFASPVSPQRQSVAAVSSKGGDGQGVDGTNGGKEGDEKLLHYMLWALYTIVVFLIGFIPAFLPSGRRAHPRAS
jgi:hypothetical protein